MSKRSQAMSTILAVDDDPDVRGMISRALKREGYRVIEADDAHTALRLAQEERPNVIILDIMMGGMNGFELCENLRAMPFVDHTPILFLSVHQSAQYVAQALDCGGDDYLRKPFVARELNARVRALLRRSTDKRTSTQVALELNAVQNSVSVNGRSIVLTPTEYQLLDYLCHHLSQHHTAPKLLQDVWNYPPGAGDTALVRNHIRNLRRKIEVDPDHPSIILSLHGRGYMVQANIIYE
jgi:DNA-binding response OmpR family regulator